eukprot:GEMP01135004.1.p2 GENE.GEMP01135004.1~~GEMP01135004.1.p2  ORF type:complete len:111 (-),score=8.60 GEMP01135004.1:91-423(-)
MYRNQSVYGHLPLLPNSPSSFLRQKDGHFGDPALRKTSVQIGIRQIATYVLSTAASERGFIFIKQLGYCKIFCLRQKWYGGEFWAMTLFGKLKEEMTQEASNRKCPNLIV